MPFVFRDSTSEDPQHPEGLHPLQTGGDARERVCGEGVQGDKDGVSQQGGGELSQEPQVKRQSLIS